MEDQILVDALLTRDPLTVAVVVLLLLQPIANVITMLTPTRTDNAAWNILSAVLNVVAGNVLRNANTDDPVARKAERKRRTSLPE